MKENHYTLGYYQNFEDNKEPQFRVSLTENINFVPHMHTQIELIYVLEGTVEIMIDGQREVMSEGEIALVAPYRIHSFKSEGLNRCLISIFEAELMPEVGQILKNKIPNNPFIKSEVYDKEVKECLTKMIDYRERCKELTFKGYMYILLGFILEHITYKENSPNDKESIEKILRFVEEGYDKPIMLEDVAKGVGYSKYHVSYLFNQHIGYKFSEYVNFLRINKAKQLLETQMKVTDIAYECGFESTRSFYRAFDKYCRMTPKEYRERCL